MLRGLVQFTKAQVAELVTLLNKDRFKDSLLLNKIVSASKQDGEIVTIEFSEEEIEVLMDEIEPDPTNEVRKILNQTRLSWQS